MSTTTDKLNTTLYARMKDFDPNVDTAVDVLWIDARKYSHYRFGFFRTVGTSDLTMTVLANTAIDGSGSDTTVKTKTLTGIQPNAVDDQVFVEVSAEDIQAVAPTAIGISLSLAFGTATDEGVALYEAISRVETANVTVDIVA